jgi:hypothetical protein
MTQENQTPEMDRPNIPELTTDAQLKAQDDINSIYDSLVVKNNAFVRMPENVFRDYFFPYFSGEKDFGDSKNIFAEWVSITGSPAASAIIVDPADKELFRVPGVFDTTVLNIGDRKRGASLQSIIEQYHLRRETIPVVGERYLAEAVNDKINTIVTHTAEQSEQEKGWYDIFARYGKVPTLIEPNTKSQNNADDIEYD